MNELGMSGTSLTPGNLTHSTASLAMARPSLTHTTMCRISWKRERARVPKRANQWGHTRQLRQTSCRIWPQISRMCDGPVATLSEQWRGMHGQHPRL